MLLKAAIVYVACTDCTTLLLKAPQKNLYTCSYIYIYTSLNHHYRQTEQEKDTANDVEERLFPGTGLLGLMNIGGFRISPEVEAGYRMECRRIDD